MPARVDERGIFPSVAPPGSDFLLDAAFFVDKTRTQQARIKKLLAQLGLPTPARGVKHVLAKSFGASASGRYLHLHIDQSTFGAKDPTYYFQLHLHGSDAHEPPSDEHTYDWAIEQLVAIGGESSRYLFFFDAEFSVDGPPPAGLVAVPLQVGGRTLSVIGVEYGTHLQANGVERVRWTQKGERLAINMSYSGSRELSVLRDIWHREHQVIMAYVKEVVPQ